MHIRTETDRPIWFSMWFLASIATFGAAFFPMFYRLIESRNRHFSRDVELEKPITAFFNKHGKEMPVRAKIYHDMNAKVWAASIILVIPIFVITYLLSKDLVDHENRQDIILANLFPERIFMPQTIPIRKYVLITIFTLGVGVVYWLYKIVNMYNAHFKAQMKIFKQMEEKMLDESV